MSNKYFTPGVLKALNVMSNAGMASPSKATPLSPPTEKIPSSPSPKVNFPVSPLQSSITMKSYDSGFGIQSNIPLNHPTVDKRRWEPNEQGIPTPNPLIKRFPNGKLDVRSLVTDIIIIIKRVTDYAHGGHGMGPLLTPVERALLSLVTPIQDLDPRFANITSKITPEELEEIHEGVHAALREAKAYAAGRGRGDASGRFPVDI